MIEKTNALLRRFILKSKSFHKEFYRITSLVDANKPVCFLRYGDGELMLMKNQVVDETTQAYLIDKWTSPGKNKLGEVLKKAITITHKNWIFGIPCKCCNKGCRNEYLRLLNVKSNQISYANLFVNSNYILFKKWIKNLKRDVVLIANESGKNNKYPFNIIKYISVPDNCVQYYEDHEKEFISYLKDSARDYTNHLFLISAGPLSEAIIYYIHSENPRSSFIDLGSSLDEYIHKKKTRPYMIDNSDYSKKVCVF